MRLRFIGAAAVLLMVTLAGTMAGAADQTAASPSTGAGSGPPVAVMPESTFAFDPVVDGMLVTHDFAIRNAGDGLLAISQVKTG